MAIRDNGIDVVGAVIIRDGLILCAQRGPGGSLAGMWEFPGGKVEPGETPQAALAREITEELCCQIIVGQPIASTRHETGSATITLHTYYCTLIAGEPEALEHAQVSWVSPGDLGQLPWAPADIPTVERIQRNH